MAGHSLPGHFIISVEEPLNTQTSLDPRLLLGRAGPSWLHRLRTSIARRGLVLAAGALVIAAAACGGNDSKTNDSPLNTNDPNSSNSQPSSTSPSSNNSANVKTSGLSDLSSYRYTLKIEGTGAGGPLADIRDGLGSVPGQTTPKANEAVTFNVDGAFVKPDKAQWKNKVGSFEVAQTVIGKQEWVTFGGQTQGPQPASSLDPSDLSLAAAMWDQSNLAGDVAGKMTCGGKETVNGVSTTKCSLDRTALASLPKDLEGFFEDVEVKDLTAFNMNLWLADQGYPVKLDVDMAGKDSSQRDYKLKMQMDLTDINKSIDIAPPK